MKKTKIVVCCWTILALTMSACSALPEKSAGTGYSEDYRDVGGEDSVFSGSLIQLQPAEDGAGGTIEIRCVSAPPQSRIAYTKADWILTADSTAEFQFEDDGWGNSGTGTIQFRKDEVIIVTEVEVSSESNWSLFVGERVSTRKKP